MKFTFWAIGAPLCGIALFTFLRFVVGLDRKSCDALAAYCGFWLMGGIPLAVLYWIVRLARRAWRDGDRVPQAAALPSSEPDSGRIFGRLN